METAALSAPRGAFSTRGHKQCYDVLPPAARVGEGKGQREAPFLYDRQQIQESVQGTRYSYCVTDTERARTVRCRSTEPANPHNQFTTHTPLRSQGPATLNGPRPRLARMLADNADNRVKPSPASPGMKRSYKMRDRIIGTCIAPRLPIRYYSSIEVSIFRPPTSLPPARRARFSQTELPRALHRPRHPICLLLQALKRVHRYRHLPPARRFQNTSTCAY